MNEERIKLMIDGLKSRKVKFAQGLSHQEIKQVEMMFHFTFPLDLRLLLQTELPVSDGFVNWRQALTDKTYRGVIKTKMGWPLDGILFDVENNNFWLKEWDDKPMQFKEQADIVKKAVTKAPALIPIYSHRYLPDMPNRAGNPVLSVHQTDIIVYGTDLLGYFANEFGFELLQGAVIPERPRRIEFWSQLVDLSNEGY